MNISVFVKRVPDTESRIRIRQDGPGIIEEGLSFVISPYDEYAMEEALRIREARGGSVRAVSIGREDAVSVLKKCLAMGADEAVLVRDDLPETYDGLRTARIIARVAEKKFPDSDLLLFGRQSVGADNALVPAMAAELLGLPHVGVVTKLEWGDGEATALREIEGGLEKVRFTLPAVLSAQKGLNEPRYETLKGIMAAKKKPIPVITLEELGLTAEALAPSITAVELAAPSERKAGTILEGDPIAAARRLVEILHGEAKVF